MRVAATGLLVMTSGCATFPGWLPASGPSGEQVAAAGDPAAGRGISVVDMTDGVARRVLALDRKSGLADTLGNGPISGYVVGAGDSLAISIWEAPPAALFSSSALDPRGASSFASATTLPDQMVNSDGRINIPFAGALVAAGRSPQQIEAEIVQRLKGKANQPQAMVRVANNATSNVTVVGEVAASVRMPLTARGERLLDALAAAGGVRQSIEKITVQVTRGNQVRMMALDAIVQDPRQNVVLQPGDVITALHQPLSFTVLGATGRNAEVNFEAQGITLVQALGRAGGLKDISADARGVFLFRMEDPAVFPPDEQSRMQTTPEGRVPVVYRLDLRDPASFFVAQSFPVRNRDVLYVTNAPAAELQKFLTIVGSVLNPLVRLGEATN